VDLEAALRETEAALESAQERLRLAFEEVDSLEAEHKGLMLAVARRRGEQSPSGPPKSQQDPWKAMTRAVAVQKMLSRENRPLGPAELSRLLVAAGRPADSAHKVAATLDYLKKKKRVLNPSHGKWVPTDGIQGANGAKPAADAEVMG
jgi:hypothetical protein